MTNTSKQEAAAIAAAIMRYLDTHPDAVETAEGIALWWLARQRFDNSPEAVKTALDYLIQQGSMDAITMPDGRLMYRRSESGKLR